MRRIWVSGFVLVVLMSLFAGFAHADVVPGTERVLRLAGTEPYTLDSGKASQSGEFDILGQVNEGLLRYGEGGKLVPGVAESWSVSPDGLVYTFRLREANWSDGSAVTAADFRYAWLRLLDPVRSSEYAFVAFPIKGAEAFAAADPKRAEYQALKSQVGIEVIDQRTLRVTLASPTDYFLRLTALPPLAPIKDGLADRHGDKYGSDTRMLLFNGPFVVASWIHDRSIILRKNLNYWDAQGVRLSGVTISLVRTDSAYQLYQMGELDVISAPTQLYADYQSSPELHQKADNVTWWLTLNGSKSPALGNANFRRALDAALDRRSFVETTLRNGSVAAEGLVPPNIAGSGGKSYRSAVGPMVNLTPDKQKASEYWNEAKKELGVEKVTISILTNDSGISMQMGQAIGQMIESALPGVTVKVDAVPFKVRLDRFNKRDFEIAFQGWGADYDDPMTFLEMIRSDSPFNNTMYVNAQYDRLVQKAMSEPDSQKRMNTMAEAERLLLADHYILPIYHPRVNYLVKPAVKGFEILVFGPRYDLKRVSVVGTAPVPGKRVTLKVGSRSAQIDGQPYTMPVAPTIVQDRTLVPLRFVTETMGATVRWQGGSVLITHPVRGLFVDLMPDVPYAAVDGRLMKLEAAPTMVNDNMMVPLRFLAELLGAEVTYDSTSQEITVKMK